MTRWLTLTLVMLVTASCQTGSRSDVAADAHKYDRARAHKDAPPEVRGGARWYLQVPSDY